MKDVILIALLATIFTWLITALGSAMVFLIKKENNLIMSLLFGFGAGVMIAASFFSLILPGIELAEELNQINWLIVGLGFLFGGLFILIIDLFLTKCDYQNYKSQNNSINKFLLVLAITLHNIPEGMAIGVAVATCGLNGTGYEPALMLALGIGLQNFPEGVAVSVPLKIDGMKKGKAFFYGQLSGFVEPISALLGVVLVYFIESILPFVLGMAAGAMIYVVVSELIPSSQNRNSRWGTIGVMIGFVVMMILDVALG